VSQHSSLICNCGGQVSKKHIIIESKLLKNLLSGDIILVDLGFDIEEEVGIVQAILHRSQIPA